MFFVASVLAFSDYGDILNMSYFTLLIHCSWDLVVGIPRKCWQRSNWRKAKWPILPWATRPGAGSLEATSWDIWWRPPSYSPVLMSLTLGNSCILTLRRPGWLGMLRQSPLRPPHPGSPYWSQESLLYVLVYWGLSVDDIQIIVQPTEERTHVNFSAILPQNIRPHCTSFRGSRPLLPFNSGEQTHGRWGNGGEGRNVSIASSWNPPLSSSLIVSCECLMSSFKILL